MSRNGPGDEYDAPNDRSTASEYTAPDPYKVGKGPGIPAALPDQVFAALQAVDTPGYVRPGDLGLDASDRAVSAAIGLLADDDGCPLDIERWNGANTTPTVWRVEERKRRAVTDGGQEPVKNREWIADQLATVDAVVTWDRFTVDRRDSEQVVTVYGWIDRDDEYKDFVWTRFYPDSGWFEYTTSSAQWTEYLHAEWFDESLDEHTECRRVEDGFGVDNCIELTEQEELVTDGGELTADETLRLTDDGLEMPDWLRGHVGEFIIKTCNIDGDLSTTDAGLPDVDFWDGPIAALPEDEGDYNSHIPGGHMVITTPDEPERCYDIVDERSDDPEPVADGGPDHDVPVEEQLTDAQLELVDDTGGDA